MFKKRRLGRRDASLDTILERLPGIEATYGALEDADPDEVTARLQRMRLGTQTKPRLAED